MGRQKSQEEGSIQEQEKGRYIDKQGREEIKKHGREGREKDKGRKNDTYIIDTSRNGQGPLDTEWCNPRGRVLGESPTTQTQDEKCDAYVWVKIPGESDGKCNGGPKAGMFWGEQAEELVRNRKTYVQYI